MSAVDYFSNHYVPVWYQKRFIAPGARDKELFYLDIQPGTFRDPRGVVHQRRPLRPLGPKHCFADDDLYTLHFGTIKRRDLESVFFGEIDAKGRRAVTYWAEFSHPSIDHAAFNDMMLYMSTQKLRTPKGLGWLKEHAKTSDQNTTLQRMVTLQQLHCAIWTETVWLIADASRSATKFIVSDHPVTVYNRRCGPRSQWCRGFNDPEIWLHGTHTIFPLSLDKVLILTNLSWVRNPYQSEVERRPNPNPWRSAIFAFTDIQTLRFLTEQEVQEINFIIKSRALRYVAAGREEWLYPERSVSKSQWHEFGHGYLLMPDPRAIHLGGEILIGYEGGRVAAFDEYGRRPWQPGYGQECRSLEEGKTLGRFKGEFAKLFGPQRRGRSFEFGHLDPERDSDELHEHHLRGLKRR